MERLGSQEVHELVAGLYIPVANISRAILWPGNPARLENDAEHSYSVALLSMAAAERLGLNSELAETFGLLHDTVPELFAGDTSVWDEAGRATKAEREASSAKQFEEKFANFPFMIERFRRYERQDTEEARLVYSLEKWLATKMIVLGNGEFWKRNRVTYKMHLAKVVEVRPKIARHPLPLSWYDELLVEIDDRKEELFAI